MMDFDFNSKELGKDMAEILRLQDEIHGQIDSPGQISQLTVSGLQRTGLEDRFGELMERVKDLVQKYKASGLTVSLNIPWGASVSLSWNFKSGGEQPSSSST